MKAPLVRFVGLLFTALVSMPFVASAQDFDRSTRTILVAGATGVQGGAVARELNARGYRVKGLTRDPNSERARAMTALGIEMVQGDFDDPESLDRALAGAYGAFSVQQYRGVGVDGEIRQGRAFADAAKRAGVQHFIYTSVAKATLNTGVPQFESKLLLENYIRSLDIPFTIVRPASFMATFIPWREDAENGRISGPLPATLERVFIAPQDIGRLAAEAFDHPEEWLGRAEAIAGQKLSYGEVAASMGRVLGHPVEYYQIPWDEFTATATPTAVAREGWYLDNSDPIDVDALRTRYPWLMTLEEYLRAEGWADAD
ncbi:MAG: NmrA/HSCARG family protein [Gammaproteobacteria bacterium]|nr:NmrA/HSCARG family protein [Gammaproteobacteria bacterium]